MGGTIEFNDATAVIMAGGGSKRMGRDKSQLLYRGKSFAAHLVETLRPCFADVLISANDASPHEGLGVEIVPDTVADTGPLAGLCAALSHSKHEVNFVIACDSPIVVFPVVERLIRGVEGYDCAVVMGDGGQFEPLFGVYRKSLLPKIEAQLQSDRRSMHALLSHCRIKAVSVRKGTLLNINTPEDYEEFLRTRA